MGAIWMITGANTKSLCVFKEIQLDMFLKMFVGHVLAQDQGVPCIRDICKKEYRKESCGHENIHAIHVCT